ncbi:hypothetical protein NDU88_003816 [Pleurodeles waltl]|uniref:Uncharacterized protein n=1 Tax=Pleurodeles waltl TaxID=8319 RepID=A0AAV7QE85_PLEWA|nr:hypothetical protein NDU88_003816 [Pleurodeles waltl]
MAARIKLRVAASQCRRDAVFSGSSINVLRAVPNAIWRTNFARRESLSESCSVLSQFVSPALLVPRSTAACSEDT